MAELDSEYLENRKSYSKMGRWKWIKNFTVEVRWIG